MLAEHIGHLDLRRHVAVDAFTKGNEIWAFGCGTSAELWGAVDVVGTGYDSRVPACDVAGGHLTQDPPWEH